jgi:hypothetical protein
MAAWTNRFCNSKMLKEANIRKVRGATVGTGLLLAVRSGREGARADYLVADSWFAQSKLLKTISATLPVAPNVLDRDFTAERSRRPNSPNKTPKAIEELVNNARDGDSGWGARKLRHKLIRKATAGAFDVGAEQIPAPSTITAILEPKGCLKDPEGRTARPLAAL